MNKAQKVVIVFFIISIVVIAGLYIYYNHLLKSKKVLEIKDNTLFYSLTCPHCKIVEQFMEENNVTQRINITQLEVSQNSTNAQQLINLGKFCKIESNYIGAIPLFYSNGSCYLGDTPIIEVLNKIGGL